MEYYFPQNALWKVLFYHTANHIG